MNEKELDLILQEGEGYKIEFKENIYGIERFSDRIIFSNPGRLISSISKKDFGKKSRTRNSLIGDLLLRSNYVEKLGTGISKIYNI
mgnify:CR=1 FL=1